MLNYIEVLEELSNANGAPGFEDDVVEVIKKLISKEYKVEDDTIRNTYIGNITKKEDRKRPLIMLDAHSDEVGFIVQSINENGSINFLPMGGWVPYNAAAQKLVMKNTDGDNIKGIVSSKPPHFMTKEEREKSIELGDMTIDVGASSCEEVREQFKIDVGTPAVPSVKFEVNEINNTLIGKAFDNRVGCACVINILNELETDKLSVDVVGAIASQEETGLRGAKITANKVLPDLAIVFEGTPADDTFRNKFIAQSVLKKGPQIRHFDNSMITNPRFLKFAKSVAKEAGIMQQDAVRVGGGTNGGSIHLSNLGVPTIVIGVPVRYIHTHYGICAVEDYLKAMEWVKEILYKLDADIIKEF